jgi:TPR repeat protein
LLLEPLVWAEACDPAHTRVALPVGRMSWRMREVWGLPQTADPDAWTFGALLFLARAHAMGELGPPDPAEAARIYCLLLRRHGHRPAALFLSRLHARGAGVAFSPGLAQHFARVAATGLAPETFDRGLMALTARLGMRPTDGVMRAQHAQAQAWLAAFPERPLAARGRLLARVARGADGRPSDLLLDRLYPKLVRAAGRGGGAPEIAVAYARFVVAKHRLGHAIGRSHAQDFTFFAGLYEAADRDRHAPAQALLGQMFRTGTIVPRDPALAYLWLRAARAQGARVEVALEPLLAEVPSSLRPKLLWLLEIDVLPSYIRDEADVARFHRRLRE